MHAECMYCMYVRESPFPLPALLHTILGEKNSFISFLEKERKEKEPHLWEPKLLKRFGASGEKRLSKCRTGKNGGTGHHSSVRHPGGL